jgi:hypothetical protein
MMQRRDWALVVLAAAKNERLTPVQLQKILFLIDKNLHPANFYVFEPYHYGPFDKRVYDDVEGHIEGDLCQTVPSKEFRGRDYELTSEGRRRAEALRSQLDPRKRDYIDKVVRWATSLSFSQLVTTIYREYPEFRARSVFR